MKNKFSKRIGRKCRLKKKTKTKQNNTNKSKCDFGAPFNNFEFC